MGRAGYIQFIFGDMIRSIDITIFTEQLHNIKVMLKNGVKSIDGLSFRTLYYQIF